MDNKENWICVYSSNMLHNVELLRHMLKEEAIDAVVLNQKDSFYPVIGEIQLFVNRNDVIRAKRIIEDAAL